MVSSVSPKYLVGLDRVVLTNAGGLNHSRRKQKTWSRKRKTAIAQSRGLYHESWRGAPAWIELFVDNIVGQLPRPLIRIPILRDAAFAEVIFHEIGHHINKAIAPTHREREDVADSWSTSLGRHYFKRKYWYIIPFAAAYGYARKFFRFFKKSA